MTKRVQYQAILNSVLEQNHPNTLLQIQQFIVANPKYPDNRKSVACLWDGGSTLNFISFDLATQLCLKGNPLELEIVTVRGQSKMIESQIYSLEIFSSKKYPIQLRN